MDLVIIESPYAGDIEKNTEYARAAVRHSLNRGEAPMASHLLYPQPGILREEVPEERAWGIAAGLEWRRRCDKQAFYVDNGWSSGMLAAWNSAVNYGKVCALRSLHHNDFMKMLMEAPLEVRASYQVENRSWLLMSEGN